jgi:AraC-like DNA-binding protein
MRRRYLSCDFDSERSAEREGCATSIASMPRMPTVDWTSSKHSSTVDPIRAALRTSRLRLTRPPERRQQCRNARMTRSKTAPDSDTVLVFHRMQLALSVVDAVGTTRPRVSLDVTVALNVSGPHRYVTRGARWNVNEGALVVSEPGSVFSIEPYVRRHRVIVLSLDSKSLIDPDARDSWRHGAVRRVPVVNDHRLQHRFRALAACVQTRHSDELAAEEALAAFVAALHALHVEPAVENVRTGIDGHAIRRATELLHEAFADELTLEELAQASELPKTRFLKSFKRNIGMSPHAYRVQLRVDHARRMLAHGAEVVDAAAAAGFCDQSHLHRHVQEFTMQWVVPSCRAVAQRPERATRARCRRVVAHSASSKIARAITKLLRDFIEH